MSVLINTDTLRRLLEAESAHNATLVKMPTCAAGSSTTIAMLVGAIVLLTLSLVILGGWLVLLWIRKLEMKNKRPKMGDEEMDDTVEVTGGKMS